MRKRRSIETSITLIGLLSVLGLFAQTAKMPVTKPRVKVTESKEHAAIRTRYEAKVKDCEQRWLDAKASAESDMKLVKDQSADSGVVQAQAKVRLARLDLALTKYNIIKDADKSDPGVACDVHPDGEMSDELDTLRNQLKYVDLCLATYRKTIDKRNADLTVRESEQVKACQSLDLYPPPK